MIRRRGSRRVRNEPVREPPLRTFELLPLPIGQRRYFADIACEVRMRIDESYEWLDST